MRENKSVSMIVYLFVSKDGNKRKWDIPIHILWNILRFSYAMQYFHIELKSLWGICSLQNTFNEESFDRRVIKNQKVRLKRSNPATGP